MINSIILMNLGSWVYIGILGKSGYLATEYLATAIFINEIFSELGQIGHFFCNCPLLATGPCKTSAWSVWLFNFSSLQTNTIYSLDFGHFIWNALTHVGFFRILSSRDFWLEGLWRWAIFGCYGLALWFLAGGCWGLTRSKFYPQNSELEKKM